MGGSAPARSRTRWTSRAPWALGSLLQLGKDQLGDGLERLVDALALGGDRLEVGNAFRIQEPLKLFQRRGVGQIALVVLDHVGDLVEVVPLLGEIGAQVLHRLHVGFGALDLRVGDEHHAVHALEDQLAGGVVEDLAGHRVEMEAGLESTDLAQRQGEEVEEEGALRLRGQRDHLPLRLLVGVRVDVLEIRRLSAEPRAVVDDLAVDLTRAVVDETHSGRRLPYSLKRLSMSSSVISANGDPAPGTCTFFRSPSKILFSSSDAFFTRSRTRPSELRVSKMTTRMTRPPITEMWRLSRSPSWKRMENSFSPMSLARPPVAAMLPAVSEASEVVSRSCVAPTEAISCPFLSTRKTIFAFASRASRSQTTLICWNSSSYMTICGCIRFRPRRVGSGASTLTERHTPSKIADFGVFRRRRETGDYTSRRPESARASVT